MCWCHRVAVVACTAVACVPVIAVIHAVAGEAPDVSLLLFPLILLASPVFSAFTLLVMSTIPKRKQKRSDIEANYRNETKPF
jgi:hypothetical protein